MCEIYVNKRYCFCTETNLAWFPSIYGMCRHLAANHVWMCGRTRVRGNWLSNMKRTQEKLEFCNSVDDFVRLNICFVVACLNLTWVSIFSREQLSQRLESIIIYLSQYRWRVMFFFFFFKCGKHFPGSLCYSLLRISRGIVFIIVIMLCSQFGVICGRSEISNSLKTCYYTPL